MTRRKLFDKIFNPTQEEIKIYEEHKERKIQELIKYGLNREEALIECRYGFPVIQLIKNQKGKCYACGEDLNVPKNGSKIEDYQYLNESAMKLDEIEDDYIMLGDHSWYRLFCYACCGLDPLIEEFEE